MPYASRNRHYWQSDHDVLPVFVLVCPIKLQQVNADYYKQQQKRTCHWIGEFFLVRPYWVLDVDSQRRTAIYGVDPAGEIDLKLWSTLCDHPPTHLITIGHIQDHGRRRIALQFAISLSFAREFAPTVAFRIYRLISYFAKDGIRASPTGADKEFYLQCIHVVCRQLLRKRVL